MGQLKETLDSGLRSSGLGGSGGWCVRACLDVWDFGSLVKFGCFDVWSLRKRVWMIGVWMLGAWMFGRLVCAWMFGCLELRKFGEVWMFGCVEKFGCWDFLSFGRFIQHARPAMGRRIIIIIIITIISTFLLL